MRPFKLTIPKKLFVNAGTDVVDLEPIITSIAETAATTLGDTQISIPVSVEGVYDWSVDLTNFVDIQSYPAVGLVAEFTDWKANIGITTADGSPYPILQSLRTDTPNIKSGITLTPGDITLASTNSSNLSSLYVGVNSYISLAGATSFKITDSRTNKIGLQYTNSHSAAIITEDRSLTDVGAVKLLRQQANTWATGDRPTVAAGVWGFNTTTSKFEGYTGSTWVDFH